MHNGTPLLAVPLHQRDHDGDAGSGSGDFDVAESLIPRRISEARELEAAKARATELARERMVNGAAVIIEVAIAEHGIAAGQIGRVVGRRGDTIAVSARGAAGYVEAFIPIADLFWIPS